jgi:ABC-type transporter Mla MlaB component
VSLLEVSIATGDSGPVIVLSGEADLSSVTQLNEVLAAQISAQTTRLTIDVTNLRSADPATAAQALMLAALIVKAQGDRGAAEPAGAGSPGNRPSEHRRDVHDPDHGTR